MKFFNLCQFHFKWHGPSALIGAGFVSWQFDKIPTWWFFVVLLVSMIRLPWLEWAAHPEPRE